MGTCRTQAVNFSWEPTCVGIMTTPPIEVVQQRRYLSSSKRKNLFQLKKTKHNFDVRCPTPGCRPSLVSEVRLAAPCSPALRTPSSPGPSRTPTLRRWPAPARRSLGRSGASLGSPHRSERFCRSGRKKAGEGTCKGNWGGIGEELGKSGRKDEETLKQRLQIGDCGKSL